MMAVTVRDVWHLLMIQWEARAQTISNEQWHELEALNRELVVAVRADLDQRVNERLPIGDILLELNPGCLLGDGVAHPFEQLSAYVRELYPRHWTRSR